MPEPSFLSNEFPKTVEPMPTCIPVEPLSLTVLPKTVELSPAEIPPAPLRLATLPETVDLAATVIPRWRLLFARRFVISDCSPRITPHPPIPVILPFFTETPMESIDWTPFPDPGGLQATGLPEHVTGPTIENPFRSMLTLFAV